MWGGGARCVDPSMRLIAGMPAVLDALVAQRRRGARALRRRAAVGAPGARAGVVALEALATFSQIGLDDDARADLARACAQLVRHTLPCVAGRRPCKPFACVGSPVGTARAAAAASVATLHPESRSAIHCAPEAARALLVSW